MKRLAVLSFMTILGTAQAEQPVKTGLAPTGKRYDVVCHRDIGRFSIDTATSDAILKFVERHVPTPNRH
jgi:hypothetical protein